MSILYDDVTPETLNRDSKECLPGFLGIEMLEVRQGVMTSHMTVKSLHGAINGFLHAGSVVTLADTTCGNATIAHLPAGARSFTTVGLKSNHLGTVAEGDLPRQCESSGATRDHLSHPLYSKPRRSEEGVAGLFAANANHASLSPSHTKDWRPRPNLRCRVNQRTARHGG